ncbi:MAG: SigE family RNA polymerase sigma factor [Acidimicrobiia bacterium]|nr:SigE family RNA polymerase sigma factor [Acidimicrobiia bacterium]
MTVDPPDPVELRVYATDDIGSFDDLYRREYRPLLRLAWSLTGRRDLGEELVQETMLTVHRRWSEVSGYSAPGAYARRLLLNAATSAWRRRGSEAKALGRLRPVESAEPAPPPDDELWSAVRSLPERQAQAVALHYIDDRSIDDIAEVLDIAASTVKVHLHRGRIALTNALGTQEGER